MSIKKYRYFYNIILNNNRQTYIHEISSRSCAVLSFACWPNLHSLHVPQIRRNKWLKTQSISVCDVSQKFKSIILSCTLFEFQRNHIQFTKCHRFKMKWHYSILIHTDFHWFSSTERRTKTAGFAQKLFCVFFLAQQAKGNARQTIG